MRPGQLRERRPRVHGRLLARTFGEPVLMEPPRWCYGRCPLCAEDRTPLATNAVRLWCRPGVDVRRRFPVSVVRSASTPWTPERPSVSACAGRRSGEPGTAGRCAARGSGSWSTHPARSTIPRMHGCGRQPGGTGSAKRQHTGPAAPGPAHGGGPSRLSRSRVPRAAPATGGPYPRRHLEVLGGAATGGPMGSLPGLVATLSNGRRVQGLQRRLFLADREPISPRRQGPFHTGFALRIDRSRRGDIADCARVNQPPAEIPPHRRIFRRNLRHQRNPCQPDSLRGGPAHRVSPQHRTTVPLRPGRDPPYARLGGDCRAWR